MKVSPQPAAATPSTGWAQPAWSQSPQYGYSPYARVEYAGFLRRWGAIFLDGLILTAVLIGVYFAVAVVVAIGGGLQTDEDFSSLEDLFGLVWFFAQWLYFAFMESSPWQATLGKKALGIVVTDEAGNRLSFGRATGRYWAKYLSYFTLLVGFIMAGFTKKKQALHDMVAGTLVVVGKREWDK